MPELLTDRKQRQLAPGDVLLVVKNVKPKDGGRRYDWKFFLVVTKHKKWIVEGWVVGANGYYSENLMRFEPFDDERAKAHYLPMDEWPNGVHQFRMALIMQRKIDIL